MEFKIVAVEEDNKDVKKYPTRIMMSTDNYTYSMQCNSYYTIGQLLDWASKKMLSERMNSDRATDKLKAKVTSMNGGK